MVAVVSHDRAFLEHMVDRVLLAERVRSVSYVAALGAEEGGGDRAPRAPGGHPLVREGVGADRVPRLRDRPPQSLRQPADDGGSPGHAHLLPEHDAYRTLERVPGTEHTEAGTRPASIVSPAACRCIRTVQPGEPDADWGEGIGPELLGGSLTLPEIEGRVVEGAIEPQPRSGAQERLENLVNQRIWAADRNR